VTNKLETCGLRHLNRSKCLSPFASHASKALGFKCLRFCPRCESAGQNNRYSTKPRQRPPNIADVTLAGPCFHIINRITVRETARRTGKSTGKRITDASWSMMVVECRPMLTHAWLRHVCRGIFQVVSATFQFENSPLCFFSRPSIPIPPRVARGSWRCRGSSRREPWSQWRLSTPSVGSRFFFFTLVIDSFQVIANCLFVQ